MKITKSTAPVDRLRIEPHPNCLDNLATNIERYGVKATQIMVPLNLFMRISISEEGVIAIHPPRSKAGDFVELRAEMDMIIEVTACSAGVCNNYKWTPIDIEIFEAE